MISPGVGFPGPLSAGLVEIPERPSNVMIKTTSMTETKLRRFIGVLLLAGDPADFSAAWHGVDTERKSDSNSQKTEKPAPGAQTPGRLAKRM
jgi:hypothetical protein